MNLTGQITYQKPSYADYLLDKRFLVWVRKQKSALTGNYPCDACHYRTAENSGVGIKPLMSAIPLTREEHRKQHQIGQYEFQPRAWWEEKVKYYVSEFMAYVEKKQGKRAIYDETMRSPQDKNMRHKNGQRVNYTKG